MQHILQGKIYTRAKKRKKNRWDDEDETEDFYFQPSALEDVKKMFNNCTVETIEHYEGDAIRVTSSLKCDHRNKCTFLHDGKILPNIELCKYCEKMVRGLVGECAWNERFERHDEESLPYEERGILPEYMFVKRGWTQRYAFDRGIDLESDSIMERMEDLQSKAMWHACKRAFEKKYCDGCVRRGTVNCHAGWHDSPWHVNLCRRSKDVLLLQAQKGIEKYFGSKENFFSVLLFCGKTIKYYDKGTKRWSNRVIAVPELKEDGKDKQMFEMARTYWPYAEKREDQDEKIRGAKHQPARQISIGELAKEHQEAFKDIDDIKYDKSLDHLMDCTYLMITKLNGARWTHHEGKVGGYQSIRRGDRSYCRSELFAYMELDVPRKECDVTTVFSKWEHRTTFSSLEGLLEKMSIL
jgi:hypothetical protein